MEVVMQAPPNIDFNFDSACSSPYISAPSSPKRFGEFYFSAPTSPTRVAAIYREINDGLSVIRTNGTCSKDGPSSSTVVPFNWDEKPAEPKSNDSNEDDFAFDFSGQLERTSLTADELFDGGVIRPLKPPSRLQVPDGVDEFPTRKSAASSPRTSKSPISQGKKMFREAFSPRHKKDFDSFAAASQQEQKEPEHDRGRERVPASKSGRRETRSLSPFRVSEFNWEEEQQQSTKAASSNSKSSSSYSLSWFCKGSKKWRLKDFLLFRSASEGRVTDKDPLGKFAVPSTSKKQEYVKNSSIRSTDSSGSVSGSRRRGPVSAHELHYTVNRAVSEEMKKKTFLPYRQGLLGFLRFNSTVHGLSRSFGSLTR
ncbi:PREDICTED: uncharacterized protein LOC104610606 [Nelumbo nucifera]|uniref:Uncharacterized protein LOC104610606 n=1 Tax=Nelumbo nucifera TaxID=4432 RepID=A0A1U8BGD1_NELNU|nr:PREDICTED: uncharacterized protein LOC104610606 [Nelumbo nucifera]